MGAFEFVETAQSNVDLVVKNIEGPVQAVAGEMVTLSWADCNIGNGVMTGPWHDTINIVLNPSTNPTAIFVVEVLVGQGVILGPGQCYTASADVRVPGDVAAEHYWEVKTNTQGEIFEGKNSNNNTGFSLANFKLDLPEIPIDGPGITRQFTAPGQSFWFKLNPQTNQDVLVSLDLASLAGITGLYIACDYMPDLQNCDIKQRRTEFAGCERLDHRSFGEDLLYPGLCQFFTRRNDRFYHERKGPCFFTERC